MAKRCTLACGRRTRASTSPNDRWRIHVDPTQPFNKIYPQVTSIVEASVALEITPRADTTYRLWLYFVPVEKRLELRTPEVPRIERKGFTLIELAYLTDREIPGHHETKALRSAHAGSTPRNRTR